MFLCPEHFCTTEVYFTRVDWIENGVFGAIFLLKQRARYHDGRTQGKKGAKLNIKGPDVNKLFYKYMLFSRIRE